MPPVYPWLRGDRCAGIAQDEGVESGGTQARATDRARPAWRMAGRARGRYLVNLNRAVWQLPSINCMRNLRQVPAQVLSIFHWLASPSGSRTTLALHSHDREG